MEDHDSSIFNCPAHIVDIHQHRIPSAAKWEHVRNDYLRLPNVDRTTSVCFTHYMSGLFGTVPFSLPLDCDRAVCMLFIAESLLTLFFNYFLLNHLITKF